MQGKKTKTLAAVLCSKTVIYHEKPDFEVGRPSWFQSRPCPHGQIPEMLKSSLPSNFCDVKQEFSELLVQGSFNPPGCELTFVFHFSKRYLIFQIYFLVWRKVVFCFNVAPYQGFASVFNRAPERFLKNLGFESSTKRKRIHRPCTFLLLKLSYSWHLGFCHLVRLQAAPPPSKVTVNEDV